MIIYNKYKNKLYDNKYYCNIIDEINNTSNKMISLTGDKFILKNILNNFNKVKVKINSINIDSILFNIDKFNNSIFVIYDIYLFDQKKLLVDFIKKIMKTNKNNKIIFTHNNKHVKLLSNIKKNQKIINVLNM